MHFSAKLVDFSAEADDKLGAVQRLVVGTWQ